MYGNIMKYAHSNIMAHYDVTMDIPNDVITHCDVTMVYGTKM